MDNETKHILASYTYYLKIERRMSPNTVMSYCSDIEELFNFYKNDTAKNIQKEDILNFLSKKKVPSSASQSERETKENADKDLNTNKDLDADKGLNADKDLDGRVSKRTQARMLSSFRSFFSWLKLEKLREDNPTDGIESPKLGTYLPDVLSAEEVALIIDTVDTSNWFGLRDKALLETLYSCGLRVSEALNLPISEIYFNEKFIRIIGKGNKQRLVPLGEMAYIAIKEYLETRPEAASPEYSDVLFLNSRGKKLSRVSAFKTVKKYTALAGIRKDVSPHTFRHSFATHLIENGADLRAVQEMLGHESILTTEIYTHIDSQKWQKTILENHPRQNKS